MPDITYPNTIAADTTTSAADIAENLFKPKSTPDNLEVVNRLDKTNFGAGGQFVTRAMVRPGQFVTGGTSGHTANRDYFKDVYPSGWEWGTLSEAGPAAVAVAGLCKTHRVDFVPSLFHVSWGLSVIVDDGNVFEILSDTFNYYGFPTAASNHGTSVHLYVNGVRINPANYYVGHSPRTLAQWDPTVPDIGLEANTSRAYRQDSRYLFGHFQFDTQNDSWFTAANTPLRKGIHTVEIRVASKRRLVRFKTTNISIVAMR